jgi:uncharacterized protein YndB with AHSA1/START domain
MPAFSLSTEIHAPPDRVFAVVADLTTHGRWSGNPLDVTAVDSSPVQVGSRYRSHATVRGIPFQAELTVTEYEPPHSFAFSGVDSTAQFTHRFTIQPGESGFTHLTRTVTLHTSPTQYVLFLVRFRLIMLPANQQALARLKTLIESTP